MIRLLRRTPKPGHPHPEGDCYADCPGRTTPPLPEPREQAAGDWRVGHLARHPAELHVGIVYRVHPDDGTLSVTGPDWTTRRPADEFQRVDTDLALADVFAARPEDGPR